MNKIIARIKGGLGNQLFCYAAARRLALANNVELVIDDVTGFARDRQYGRQYALDHLHIPVRKATPAERLELFQRYRRGLMNITRAEWSPKKPTSRDARRSPAARRGADRRGVLHAGTLLESLPQLQAVEHARKAASDRAFT